MRIFAKLMLWLISIAALLVAIVLIGGGFLAQSTSGYAQRSLGQIALWGWIGAVPAIVFAVAANPLLSRLIPFLRGERARWIASMIAIVAGSGAAFMLLNNASVAMLEIQYKLDPSPERLVLDYTEQVLSDGVSWGGTKTIDEKYYGRDPADALTSEPASFGAFSQWELCLPFEEPAVPVSGRPPATSPPLLEVLNSLEGLKPYTRDQARLVFSEALRLCRPDDPAAQEQSLVLLQEQLKGNGYYSALSHVVMGQRLRDGVGVAADPVAAVSHFERAAAESHPVASYLLAHASETGLGGLAGKPDDIVRHYIAAKGAGVAMAARRLARAAASGRFGLGQDDAIDLYAELCGLGELDQNQSECMDYAYSLRDGAHGEPKSPSVARALFVAVCEAERDNIYTLQGACANAGSMAQDGVGGDADLALARKFFSKSCEADAANSCNSYGVLLLQGKGGPIDDPGAEAAFRKGCDSDLGLSCFNLGLMHDGGWGVPKSKAKADELFAKACKLGYSDGCDRND